jgi:hypothetical protein
VLPRWAGVDFFASRKIENKNSLSSKTLSRKRVHSRESVAPRRHVDCQLVLDAKYPTGGGREIKNTLLSTATGPQLTGAIDTSQPRNDEGTD